MLYKNSRNIIGLGENICRIGHVYTLFYYRAGRKSKQERHHVSLSVFKLEFEFSNIFLLFVQLC